MTKTGKFRLPVHPGIILKKDLLDPLGMSINQLAKELRVPVIAVSQLSRAVEQRGGDKRPILSDLRESGALEQDADAVMFVYRAEYYDQERKPENEGRAEIVVAKQRNGPVGNLKLAFIPKYTRFENLSRMEP